MSSLVLGLKIGLGVGCIKGCYHGMRNYKPVYRDMKNYAIAGMVGLGIEGSTTYLTTKVFSDTSVITPLLTYPYISTCAGALMTLGIGYYSGIVNINFFKVPNNNVNNYNNSNIDEYFKDNKKINDQSKYITHDKTKKNRKE